MTAQSTLTISGLLGEAARLLSHGEYLEIKPPDEGLWSSAQARLFEDPYSIVGILVFDTWDALVSNWERAQSDLVELISDHLSPGEPKAWDGYLVLLTPSPVSEELNASSIRYDTARLRKIVATGKEIERVSDLETVLAPFLPIRMDLIETDAMGVFTELPRILAQQGIPQEAVEALIDAYVEREPLMESLSEYWSGHEDR